MSIEQFEKNIVDYVVSIKSYNDSWGGDILDLEDSQADGLCYEFLMCMTSWWDDILPPVVVKEKSFIKMLYDKDDNSPLVNILKNDIYLHIEDHIRETVQDVFDRVMIPEEDIDSKRMYL
jgi:hypothetical protein